MHVSGQGLQSTPSFSLLSTGTGGEPSAAGFSVGSIDKVQATNGGRLSFNCLLCDNIQFQREPKHPDWTGQGITVT